MIPKTSALEQPRQIAAMLTAFMLPLSTSGQAIGVTIFGVLTLASLDRPRMFAKLRHPAAFIPSALFGLILIGVLWSNQPLAMAMKWVGPYAKLLLIPLFLTSTCTLRQIIQIGLSFVTGCALVLIVSSVSLIWPSGPWSFFILPGVPVKDNAVQSECFALCALGLGMACAYYVEKSCYKVALAAGILALLFFANIFMIYISKTGAITALVILGLFIIRLGGWRRGLLVAVVALAIGTVTAMVSKSAQYRIVEISNDVRGEKVDSFSTASRKDFWNKALIFIRQAPVFGHGTGSIRPLYQSMEATTPSPYGQAVADPHNQFLHTTIQVGLIGGFLLLAMWAVHFKLFMTNDFASTIGLAVVLQNALGSLFNSHISQVTQGMLYCLAVGLIGSLVLSKRDDETDERQT